MRVLMIASECVPFAKTGGLADVVGALPRALANLGHRVDVVIPRYRGIAAGARAGRVTPCRWRVDSSMRTCTPPTIVACDSCSSTAPSNDRAQLYGIGNDDYPDNPARFALLTRAALEWAASSGRLTMSCMRTIGRRASPQFSLRGSSGEPTPFVTLRQSSRFTTWYQGYSIPPGCLVSGLVGT